MNLLQRIMGKPSEKSETNRGTRLRDESHANSHWIGAYLSNPAPVLVYRFPDIYAAAKAMLQISYFKATSDGEIICTEVLDYGYYTNAYNEGEVIICGRSFNYDQWKEAKQAFEKAGGKLYREQEPEKKVEPPKTTPQLGNVVYLRDEKSQSQMGSTFTYHVYKANNKATALDFLDKQNVKVALEYIIVETPEGNFGKDKDGIFKE